jgi:glycosyltransferase involved in cell wall biosynthesis
LIGDGPLRRVCEEYVSNEALKDCVTFLGKKTDIARYYPTFNCIIIPSRWEGMPNVLFEALVYKKVVIANDVGGISEVAAQIPTVLLVNPRDSSGLFQKLQEYCDKKNEYEQMVEKGYRKIKDRFTLKRMIGEYETFYDTILNSSEQL